MQASRPVIGRSSIAGVSPVRAASKPIPGPSPARRDDRLPAHPLPAFWPLVAAPGLDWHETPAAVPAPSLFEG